MYSVAPQEPGGWITLSSMNLCADSAKPAKNTWTDPKLIVFGGVETLTLGHSKSLGTGDALTFENQTTSLSQ
jgi:hypothetical protein